MLHLYSTLGKAAPLIDRFRHNSLLTIDTYDYSFVFYWYCDGRWGWVL